MPKSTTINPNIAAMEYAVRGPIPQRAAELERQGRRTIPCNIGNPQALGQRPISYYREVLSFLEEPSRLARERSLGELYRRDPAPFEGLGAEPFASQFTLDLCEDMLARLGSGLGAYTDSKGPAFIREAVARFIDARDGGVPADPENVYLTNGASEAVKYILEMLIADERDGILIPIPQYPLYSAAIKKAGGVQVDYFPDEEGGWALDRSILEEAAERARRDGVRLKAIVVINPGNPTGAILPAKSVRDVVDFADQHGLAIIADEVYQDNLYGAEFASFAGAVGERDVALFSLHSTSKGFCGECGRRGGYVEMRNPPPIEGSSLSFGEVLTKQASVSLCSNTVGQALTYLMVTPPPPGSPPHELFVRERQAILDELLEKATLMRTAFEGMEGMRCFGRTGALYLFPRMDLMPPGKTDFDYCMALLESTGLCTVNGSGFGQAPGTSHLRVAFLPPREMLEQVLPAWVEFHNSYVSGAQVGSR